MQLRFVIPLIMLLTSCDMFSDSRTVVTLSGKTMGTVFNISVINLPEAVSAEDLGDQIEAELIGFNDKLSNWQQDSEISMFNVSKDVGWVDASDEFYTVLEESFYIHQLSRHAFDVTVSPLIDLWGFGWKQNDTIIPSDEAVLEALQNVGMVKLIELNSTTRQVKKLKPDVNVNLSAVAKGYGIDVLAALLEKNGIKEYLVEIGGDLIVKGHNGDDKPWVVGIEKPDNDGKQVEELVMISQFGMATSGDYRNYIEKDGKRFSHIIDPVTGKPVTHNLASVTIFSDTAMRADALATAMMVLGLESGLEIANKNNIAAYFLTRDGVNFKATSSAQYKQLKADAGK
ncbi:MAG: thiamine biosynthesis protein ApbE [Hyphomicrobiales bacterium]|nr:MAG: thiamine biosynthesis protein ApbE [Hyphomicrobiales bacterium]